MSEVEKALAELERIDFEYDRSVSELAAESAYRQAATVAHRLAAVHAESAIGHEANCRCVGEHQRLEGKGGEVHTVKIASWTDPLCLPSLKRVAIIRAEARVEALSSGGCEIIVENHPRDCRLGPDDCEHCKIVRDHADARAELERLREK